jgi:hypothetical protein
MRRQTSPGVFESEEDQVQLKGVNVMVRFNRLINVTAFGAALLFSNAAFSQAPDYASPMAPAPAPSQAQDYPYFYPFESVKGLYYAPGTPVLQAQGPVAPADSTSGTMAPPIVSSPPGKPSEQLMTGRSVAVGVVGNHCMTEETTCLLDRSSIQGRRCSCIVDGRRRSGTVGP